MFWGKCLLFRYKYKCIQSVQLHINIVHLEFFRGLLAFARILVSQLKKRKRLFNFNVGQTLTAQDKTLISLAAGFKEKWPAPVIVNILSPITSANHCHPPPLHHPHHAKCRVMESNHPWCRGWTICRCPKPPLLKSCSGKHLEHLELDARVNNLGASVSGDRVTSEENTSWTTAALIKTNPTPTNFTALCTVLQDCPPQSSSEMLYNTSPSWVATPPPSPKSS